MENKKPKGLIQNQRLVPNQSVETVSIIKTPDTKKVIKKNNKNQNQNIKVSMDTKNQLDILMKLTNNKFGYEMIETLIDSYVESALDPDKKRAFKSLTNL